MGTSLWHKLHKIVVLLMKVKRCKRYVLKNIATFDTILT